MRRSLSPSGPVCGRGPIGERLPLLALAGREGLQIRDLLALQPEADLLAGHDTFEHRALGHLERHGSRGPVDAFDGFVSDRDASTGDIDGLDNANTEDLAHVDRRLPRRGYGRSRPGRR